MSGKRALVVVAEGGEELEVVTPIDVLRRANVEVVVAGLKSSSPVLLSRQVTIVPEVSLTEAIAGSPFDIIILPGGRGGSRVLAESTELGAALKAQESAGGMIATICAAPLALKQYGVMLGKKLTSFPTSKDLLADSYNYQEDRVVIDGNLISSRGPAHSLEFSLALAERLVGKEKADEVAKGMLAY